MKEAATTWALVVGINKYADPKIRQLHGPVRDAIRAVGWLRKLGVPDTQILFHAAPSSDVESDVEKLGLTPRIATEPEIEKSIVDDLKAVTTGTRLFVFLCGHGLHEPASGQLLLMTDATKQRMSNLGLDGYIRLLLSLNFRRQFLFMDGCQNYPYSTGVRPRIKAANPSYIDGYDANPKNGMVASFAASQGEVATEIGDGSGGLFMRHLLDAIELDNPCEEAVEFDFDTGERTFDVRKAVSNYISGVVSAEAADQSITQNPRYQPYEKGTEDYFPTFSLGNARSRAFSVDIDPGRVTPAIKAVKLSVESTRWYRSLPRPGKKLTVPITGHFPESEKAVISCQLDPSAPWDAIEKTHEFIVNEDTNIVLAFNPRPPAGPGGDLETLSVKALDEDGSPRTAFGDSDYAVASRAIGDTVEGIRFDPQEDGPEFHVQTQKLSQGRSFAFRWSQALGRVASAQGLHLETTIRANDVIRQPKNVEIKFPKGGAASIAGFLADSRSIVFETPDVHDSEPAWRSPKALSLSAVESSPLRTLDPGPWQIRLELPWGKWRTVVDVPAAGRVIVQLPDRVGVPPLRNQFAEREISARMGRILGVGGRRRSGTINEGLYSDKSEKLKTARYQGSALWALAVNRQDSTVARIVSLGTARPICFPMPRNARVAVDLSGQNPRVEPLSELRTPQWDALVSSGRLDEITTSEADGLVHTKWEELDPILGLAGAYALFASERWGILRIATENLGRLMPTLDVYLLSIVAHNEGLKPLNPQDAATLVAIAGLGDVPCFRWGVRLALDLIASAPSSRAMSKWRTALSRIEQNLSPFSIWTVWNGRK